MVPAHQPPGYGQTPVHEQLGRARQQQQALRNEMSDANSSVSGQQHRQYQNVLNHGAAGMSSANQHLLHAQRQQPGFRSQMDEPALQQMQETAASSHSLDGTASRSGHISTTSAYWANATAPRMNPNAAQHGDGRADRQGVNVTSYSKSHSQGGDSDSTDNLSAGREWNRQRQAPLVWSHSPSQPADVVLQQEGFPQNLAQNRYESQDEIRVSPWQMSRQTSSNLPAHAGIDQEARLQGGYPGWMRGSLPGQHKSPPEISPHVAMNVPQNSMRMEGPMQQQANPIGMYPALGRGRLFSIRDQAQVNQESQNIPGFFVANQPAPRQSHLVQNDKMGSVGAAASSSAMGSGGLTEKLAAVGGSPNLPKSASCDVVQPSNMYPVDQLFIQAARRLAPKENPLASLKSFSILYSSFWEWSGRAIDSVALYLKEISFIVFVELWARLLTISLKKAAIFMKRFGDAHVLNHFAEISEMKRVKTLPALKDTPFVVRVLRGEKFSIKVDNLTRKLLTTRLTLENDTVILDIFQKRAVFETITSESAPLENGGDTTLAMLLSQTYKGPHLKNLGGAIVTPSLSLLCGLLPMDGDNTDFPASDPYSKISYLSDAVLGLYRLPLPQRKMGNEQPEETSTSSEDGLEWRCAMESNRRKQNSLERHLVDGSNPPSVLEYRISVGHIKMEMNASSANNILDFEVPTVDKYSRGRFVSIATSDNNAIWVWDLLKYQWMNCSGIYKSKVIEPWLFSYAKSRVDTSRGESEEHDLILEDTDSSEAAASGQKSIIEISLNFGQHLALNREDFQMSLSAVDPKIGEEAGQLDDSDKIRTSFIDSLRSGNLLSGSRNITDVISQTINPHRNAPISLVGHELAVTSMNFLPPFLTGGVGGTTFALSSSYDGNMILWDLEKADIMSIYKGSSAILDSDVDGFGYLFLSGHQDRAACLWSMDRKNPLRVLNRHSGQVEKVKFHPNSILIATGASDENRVRLWDYRIPDIAGVMNGIACPRCIEFSPDGRLIALSGSGSPIVNIWDMVAGSLFTSINVDQKSHDHFPLSMSFSQESSLLATTDSSGSVQIWDVNAMGAKAKSPASTIGVIDQCGLGANIDNIEALNDPQSKYRVAHYSCADSKIRSAVFTETNVLLLINEVVPSHPMGIV